MVLKKDPVVLKSGDKFVIGFIIAIGIAIIIFGCSPFVKEMEFFGDLGREWRVLIFALSGILVAIFGSRSAIKEAEQRK